jgi:polyribonucleotide nucleotidyltransferase
MLGAVTFGHEQMQPVIDAIIDLAEKAAKEPFDFQPPDSARARARSASWPSAKICATPTPSPTSERQEAVAAAKAKAAMLAALTEEQAEIAEPRVAFKESSKPAWCAATS